MENDKKDSILNRDSSDLRAKVAQMNEKIYLQQEKEKREQVELEEFYRNEEDFNEASQFLPYSEMQEDFAKSVSLEPDFQENESSQVYAYTVDEEDTSDIKIGRIIDFSSSHKYLLCLIPLIFLVLFFVTAPISYYGTIKKTNFTYLGNIKNSLPNGTGTITYSNGDSYNGNFVDGKLSGRGLFASKAGKWTYSGNFTDGLANGTGIMTTADGQKHKEIFKNGALSQ